MASGINQVALSYPGLHGRLLVGQEAQCKMSRALAIESKAVHALCRIGSELLLQELIFDSESAFSFNEVSEYLRSSSSDLALNRS